MARPSTWLLVLLHLVVFGMLLSDQMHVQAAASRRLSGSSSHKSHSSSSSHSSSHSSSSSHKSDDSSSDDSSSDDSSSDDSSSDDSSSDDSSSDDSSSDDSSSDDSSSDDSSSDDSSSDDSSSDDSSSDDFSSSSHKSDDSSSSSHKSDDSSSDDSSSSSRKKSSSSSSHSSKSSKCIKEWIGDGWCDYENNNKDCYYDGGDCCSCTCDPYAPNKCGVVGYLCKDPYAKCYPACELKWIGDGWCDPQNNGKDCAYDGGDCCSCTCDSKAPYHCGIAGYYCKDSKADCSPPCAKNWIGDGYCDTRNNVKECDYDGGDCCPCTCTDGKEYDCGVAEYHCKEVHCTDPCHPNPCKHDGYCEEYSGSGHCCVCPHKYGGLNCQTYTGGHDYHKFYIELEYEGKDWTHSLKDVFKKAAKRWEEVVTHHPPCGSSKRYPGGRLLIKSKLVDIDGHGKYLAQAAPDLIRANCPTTSLRGFMEFDVDDISYLESSGKLEGVVLHEIGHVLGIGTLWDEGGCSTCYDDGSSKYTCPAAIEVYNDLLHNPGGDDNKIIELDGGHGIACANFDERIFEDELMTGVFDSPMYLSKLTAASLEDLGYVVDGSKVDPYTLPAFRPPPPFPVAKPTYAHSSWSSYGSSSSSGSHSSSSSSSGAHTSTLRTTEVEVIDEDDEVVDAIVVNVAGLS